MNATRRSNSGTQGFSLLEVLVSMSVVALGLLALVSFQSRVTGESSDNKAKAEAVTLAQARIEELRNYTNDPNDPIRTKSEFDTFFAPVENSNATEIGGTNAAFTRTETFGENGSSKTISVKVAWTDKFGGARSVTLVGELGWESPRSVGDIARDPTIAQVSSPMGRARLGEGQLPEGVTLTEEDSNGDGTYTYDAEGSTDRRLVVGSDIVLTLEDACQLTTNDQGETQTGTCTDFVKIKGRVYIDTATQRTLKAGDVYIKASDAAYCQRYYLTYDAENPDGVAHTVNADTVTALLTETGDYKYFDYTCYLGGGWHGNIGILLSNGIAQDDKVCQGDPNGAEDYQQPVIAARRAYRGMLYKIDASNQDTGKQVDANGDTVYYSVGIADGVTLPDPDSSDKTHDFVISKMPVSATEGENCTSLNVMLRSDSTVDGVAGALFAGMPTDFVCLNPSNIDAFDDQVYGVEDSCKFDPTDPPTLRHEITGTISVVGGGEYIDLITVNTSDGPLNCDPLDFGGGDAAQYRCDVYDWGNGWNGYIQVKPNSYAIACSDGGADGTSDQRMHLTSVSGDAADKDFSCVAGNIVIVSGEVTTANHTKILTASTSIDAANGSCYVDADGLGYSCTTGVFDTETWSGTITFTTTGGKVCGVDVNVNTGVGSFTDMAPGIYTRNLHISNNTTCP